MDILSRLVKQENRCVIVVTHSHRAATYADEVFGLSGGKLVCVHQKETQAEELTGSFAERK